MKKWNSNFKKSIEKLSLKDKEKFYDFLTLIVMNLYNMGFLPNFQIYLTCNNFNFYKNRDEYYYFFKLANKKSKFKVFKFDCDSFIRKSDFLQ